MCHIGERADRREETRKRWEERVSSRYLRDHLQLRRCGLLSHSAAQTIGCEATRLCMSADCNKAPPHTDKKTRGNKMATAFISFTHTPQASLHPTQHTPLQHVKRERSEKENMKMNCWLSLHMLLPVSFLIVHIEMEQTYLLRKVGTGSDHLKHELSKAAYRNQQYRNVDFNHISETRAQL